MGKGHPPLALPTGAGATAGGAAGGAEGAEGADSPNLGKGVE